METVRSQADGTLDAARRVMQRGKLTRILFSDKEPGKAHCAQMLELETDRTTTQVADTRPARLPGRVVRFSVNSIDAERAPLIVPGETGWSRAMLSTIMLVTDWPVSGVGIGDEWKRSIEVGGIKGRQTFRVSAMDTVDSEQQVKIEVHTKTKVSSSSSGGKLLSANVKLSWSSGKGELISLTGEAVYQEPLRTGGRLVKIGIVLLRTKPPKKPSKSRLAAERRTLIKLANAIGAYHRDDYLSALRTLVPIKRRHRGSIFKPMVDYLIKRIQEERVSQEPLPTEELKKVLVSLLASWDQAETDEDVELGRRCRKSLQHLAKINRPEIVRLLEDSDGRLRGLGCFALAFGTAPGDVALIQEHCGDGDLRVRRTAFYALAIRASPFTDVELLLGGLEDGDATVRRRAGEGLGKCVAKDSDDIRAVRGALVKRLHDDSPMVVVAAAQALIRIGSADDIAKIKEAAGRVEPASLKKVLEELVSKSCNR
jgi:hypothetical protein